MMRAERCRHARCTMPLPRERYFSYFMPLIFAAIIDCRRCAAAVAFRRLLSREQREAAIFSDAPARFAPPR